MNILHVDSSISGSRSVSRTLSRDIVAKLTANNPAARVSYRDLVNDPLPLLNSFVFGAMQTRSDDVGGRLVRQVQQEFLDADVIVAGVPMYNFGIAAQLKTWIDYLGQAGVTFNYTEQGPVGLVGGKRLIIASSRGGFYGNGMPAAQLDHQESYVTSLFAFFGITDIEIIRAEGVALGAEATQVAMDAARAAIAALRAGAINANAA